jgi:hypothetical protein
VGSWGLLQRAEAKEQPEHFPLEALGVSKQVVCTAWAGTDWTAVAGSSCDLTVAACVGSWLTGEADDRSLGGAPVSLRSRDASSRGCRVQCSAAGATVTLYLCEGRATQRCECLAAAAQTPQRLDVTVRFASVGGHGGGRRAVQYGLSMDG